MDIELFDETQNGDFHVLFDEMRRTFLIGLFAVLLTAGGAIAVSVYLICKALGY